MLSLVLHPRVRKSIDLFYILHDPSASNVEVSSYIPALETVRCVFILAGLFETARMGVLYEERLEYNRRQRGVLGSGVGVCVGCFAGMGYGRTIGFGRIVSNTVVVPSRTQLFVHDGKISGAFCGATVGVGMGTFLGSGIYFRKIIKLPSPFDRNRGRPYFLLPNIPNIPKCVSNALRRTPAAVEAALERYPMQLARFGGRILRVRGR